MLQRGDLRCCDGSGAVIHRCSDCAGHRCEGEDVGEEKVRGEGGDYAVACKDSGEGCVAVGEGCHGRRIFGFAGGAEPWERGETRAGEHLVEDESYSSKRCASTYQIFFIPGIRGVS